MPRGVSRRGREVGWGKNKLAQESKDTNGRESCFEAPLGRAASTQGNPKKGHSRPSVGTDAAPKLHSQRGSDRCGELQEAKGREGKNSGPIRVSPNWFSKK